MALYQVDLNTLESFSFVFKNLWSSDIVRRAKLNIVDTILFHNGEPFQWIFTSEKTGEIMKKKSERLETISEVVRIIKNKSRALRGFKDTKVKSKIATVWYMESGRRISSYLVDEAELSAILRNHLTEILCIQVFMGGYYLKGNGIFEHRMHLLSNGTEQHSTFEMIDPIAADAQSMFTNNCEKLAVSEQQHSIATAMCRYLNKHIQFMTGGARVSHIIFQVVFNSSWMPYLVSCRKVMLEDASEQFIYKREQMIYPMGEVPELPCFNPASLLLPINWTEYSMPKRLVTGDASGTRAHNQRNQQQQLDRIVQPSNNSSSNNNAQGRVQQVLELPEDDNEPEGAVEDFRTSRGVPTRMSALTVDSALLNVEDALQVVQRRFGDIAEDGQPLQQQAALEEPQPPASAPEQLSENLEQQQHLQQQPQHPRHTITSNLHVKQQKSAFSPAMPKPSKSSQQLHTHHHRSRSVQGGPVPEHDSKRSLAVDAGVVLAAAAEAGANVLEIVGKDGQKQRISVPMPDMARAPTQSDLVQEIMYAGVDLAAANAVANEAAVLAAKISRPKKKRPVEKQEHHYDLYRPSSAHSLSAVRTLSKRNVKAVEDRRVRGPGGGSFSAQSLKLLDDLDAAPVNDDDDDFNNTAAETPLGRTISSAVSDDGVERGDGTYWGDTADFSDLDMVDLRARKLAQAANHSNTSSFIVKRVEGHTQASGLRASFYSNQIRDDDFYSQPPQKTRSAESRRPISAPHEMQQPPSSPGMKSATSATSVSSKFNSSYKFLAPELRLPVHTTEATQYVFSRQLPSPSRKGFSFNKALPLSSTKCFGSYCSFGLRAHRAATGTLNAPGDSGEHSSDCTHQLNYKSILLAAAESRFIGANLDENIDSLLDQITVSKVTSEQLYTYFVRRHLNRVAQKCLDESRMLTFAGEEAPHKMWSDLNAVYRRLVYADALARVHPSRFYYTVPMCAMCYQVYSFMDAQRETIVLHRPEEHFTAEKAAARAARTLDAQHKKVIQNSNLHSRQAAKLDEHIRKSRSGNFADVRPDHHAQAMKDTNAKRPNSAGAVVHTRRHKLKQQHQQQQQSERDADNVEGKVAEQTASVVPHATKRKPRISTDDNHRDRTHDRGIGSKGPVHKISESHRTKGKAAISSWVKLFTAKKGTSEQYEDYTDGDAMFDWDAQNTPTYLRPTSSSGSRFNNGTGAHPSSAYPQQQQQQQQQRDFPVGGGAAAAIARKRPHSAQDFRRPSSATRNRSPPSRATTTTAAAGSNVAANQDVMLPVPSGVDKRRPRSADAVHGARTQRSNSHTANSGSNASSDSNGIHDSDERNNKPPTAMRRPVGARSQQDGHSDLLNDFSQHIQAAFIAPVAVTAQQDDDVSAAYAYSSLPFMAAPHFPAGDDADDGTGTAALKAAEIAFGEALRESTVPAASQQHQQHQHSNHRSHSHQRVENSNTEPTRTKIIPNTSPVKLPENASFSTFAPSGSEEQQGHSQPQQQHQQQQHLREPASGVSGIGESNLSVLYEASVEDRSHFDSPPHNRSVSPTAVQQNTIPAAGFSQVPSSTNASTDASNSAPVSTDTAPLVPKLDFARHSSEQAKKKVTAHRGIADAAAEVYASTDSVPMSPPVYAAPTSTNNNTTPTITEASDTTPAATAGATMNTATDPVNAGVKKSFSDVSSPSANIPAADASHDIAASSPSSTDPMNMSQMLSPLVSPVPAAGIPPTAALRSPSPSSAAAAESHVLKHKPALLKRVPSNAKLEPGPNAVTHQPLQPTQSAQLQDNTPVAVPESPSSLSPMVMFGATGSDAGSFMLSPSRLSPLPPFTESPDPHHQNNTRTAVGFAVGVTSKEQHQEQEQPQSKGSNSGTPVRLDTPSSMSPMLDAEPTPIDMSTSHASLSPFQDMTSLSAASTAVRAMVHT